MRVSLVSLLLLAPVAVAQELEPDPAAEPEIVYPKETILDFRDWVEVEADVIRPEGSLVSEHPGPRFAPHLPVRTEFGREMHASVDAVR